MNSHITNLYPKPNGSVAAMEMLSVPNDSVKTFTTTYEKEPNTLLLMFKTMMYM